MEPKVETLKVTPPGLIPSLVAGFNYVANHIYLILLPLAVDLLLWFGPHLRVKQLLLPALEESWKSISALASQGVAQNVQIAQKMWEEFLNQFNLLSVLRTYPIGMPSLLSGLGANENPLGAPQSIEIASIGLTLLIILVCLLVGLILGSIYFNMVARATTEESVKAFLLGEAGWQAMQALLLSVILIGLLILFTLPGSILIGIFVWINPGLAQVALFLMVVVLFWFFVPLVFSPHGIFVLRQNALTSIFTSVRMVRFYLPSTGLFLLTMLLIGQGLDLLWRVPPASSWMILVGMLGHAFIYTSLLAASFAYYRGGLQWMQANLKQFKSADKRL